MSHSYLSDTVNTYDRRVRLGVRGLSILKEIRKTLPKYDYFYLGDSARTPYGTRSLETVHAYTLEAVDYLFRQGCELVIIACNTASADALRRIQQEYLPQHYPNRRVLGVIIPAAEEAMAATKNKRIGVLATEGTVASGTVVSELKKLDKTTQVFQQSAPMLVTLVESGEHRTKAAKLILAGYLKPLLAKRIDTLILACTHYGHMEAEVRAIVKGRVRVISEGKVVAKKLKTYLVRHPELEKKLSRHGRVTFATTGEVLRFDQLGTRFFGASVRAQQVSLMQPRAVRAGKLK